MSAASSARRHTSAIRISMVDTARVDQCAGPYHLLYRLAISLSGTERLRRPGTRPAPHTWQRKLAYKLSSPCQNGELALSASKGDLSGGQRRLTEIMRALMTEPTMLLLDEPMAGVHPRLARQIGVQLLGLCAEGMTILMVEHELAIMDEFCDPVIVMAEGAVLATGAGPCRGGGDVPCRLSHHHRDRRECCAPRRSGPGTAPATSSTAYRSRSRPDCRIRDRPERIG
jgi:hypothetical protein